MFVKLGNIGGNTSNASKGMLVLCTCFYSSSQMISILQRFKFHPYFSSFSTLYSLLREFNSTQDLNITARLSFSGYHWLLQILLCKFHLKIFVSEKTYFLTAKFNWLKITFSRGWRVRQDVRSLLFT